MHFAFTYTVQSYYLTLNYLGLKALYEGMSYHYQHFAYKEIEAQWYNLLRVIELMSKVSGR